MLLHCALKFATPWYMRQLLRVMRDTTASTTEGLLLALAMCLTAALMNVNFNQYMRRMHGLGLNVRHVMPIYGY
jgi:hypothetical protein